MPELNSGFRPNQEPTMVTAIPLGLDTDPMPGDPQGITWLPRPQ